jgi:uncharacterized membrane protein HdeD (DUF308 family)
MSTISEAPISTTTALRRLYLVRFAFAVVWAIVLFAFGSELSPATAGLLVIYPLFDLAAAIVDARSAARTRSVTGLYINMALSLLAAVGLALAATSGVTAVLVVWGVWAITAGVVQLVVAIGRRRALGGQWPMIISGGLSAVVGAGFVLISTSDTAMLSSVGGYAIVGGIFFLVSALRLRR